VVTVGLTETDDEVAPVLQTKLDAPLALSVVELPTQIIAVDADTEIVGAALTLTVTDALAEHPPALVPTTE